MFAVTCGFGCDAYCDAMTAALDDYQVIMMKALADRLAEAFAEKLHADVRTKHWGYSRDEHLTTEELLQVGRHLGFWVWPPCRRV